MEIVVLEHTVLMEVIDLANGRHRKNNNSQIRPSGFLMFSGGIDKQHRAVMG